MKFRWEGYVSGRRWGRHVRHCLLICLALSVSVGPVSGQVPETLRLRNPSDKSVDQSRATLGLRPRQGWVRSERVYDNFAMSFDYRLLEPGTQAEVIVRAQIHPTEKKPRGFVVKLPSTASPGGPTQGATSDGLSEWRRCDIRADLGRIEVSVNGAMVNSFLADRFVGYIVLQVRKGNVEFRQTEVARLQHPLEVPPGALTEEDLVRQGGEKPVRLRGAFPEYTLDAYRANIGGRVKMRVLVLPDGSVGAINVVVPLDPDLDLASVGSVREWKFKPAMLNGQPVPVVVDAWTSFRRY